MQLKASAAHHAALHPCPWVTLHRTRPKMHQKKKGFLRGRPPAMWPRSTMTVPMTSLPAFKVKQPLALDP